MKGEEIKVISGVELSKKCVSHTLLNKRQLGNLDRHEAEATALLEKAGT